MERLLDEAAGCPFTRTAGSAFGAKVRPRRVTSPFDMASASGSEVAVTLGESDTAFSVLRTFTPVPLRLSATTYVLYSKGSFIGVHTDRAGCELNLLVVLSGAPTEFEYAPALAREPAPTIFELARQGGGFIAETERVALARRGDAVAFVGSVLPHQRRPVTEPLLMLSLCYREA
ncbi:hypothetical protein [Actinomadura monticuli]|uniref:Fe2OG dioxygenase domain-containing protein n=1 Tax=Actinomadura monticuli TaxID=3097367 RepID=A0ABV4QI15_9ACTN